jgi:hypothetical protein
MHIAGELGRTETSAADGKFNAYLAGLHSLKIVKVDADIRQNQDFSGGKRFIASLTSLASNETMPMPYYWC